MYVSNRVLVPQLFVASLQAPQVPMLSNTSVVCLHPSSSHVSQSSHVEVSHVGQFCTSVWGPVVAGLQSEAPASLITVTVLVLLLLLFESQADHSDQGPQSYSQPPSFSGQSEGKLHVCVWTSPVTTVVVTTGFPFCAVHSFSPSHASESPMGVQLRTKFLNVVTVVVLSAV